MQTSRSIPAYKLYSHRVFLRKRREVGGDGGNKLPRHSPQAYLGRISFPRNSWATPKCIYINIYIYEIARFFISVTWEISWGSMTWKCRLDIRDFVKRVIIERGVLNPPRLLYSTRKVIELRLFFTKFFCFQSYLNQSAFITVYRKFAIKLYVWKMLVLLIIGLHESKTIHYFCNYCIALVYILENVSLVSVLSVNMKSIINLSWYPWSYWSYADVRQ